MTDKININININNFYISNPDFDINFYKLHYDLNNLSEYELIKHYLNFGKKENRLISANVFLKLYPNFDCEFYKKYNDILNLKLSNDQLYIHYWLTGKKENRLIDKLSINLNFNEIIKNLINKNVCFIYYSNLTNPDLTNSDLTNTDLTNTLIDQIDYIKNSDLYNKLDYIFVLIYGKYIQIVDDVKIKIIYYSPNISEWSISMFEKLKYFCNNIPFNINVLNICIDEINYINKDDLFINNWRKYLEYFLIENYNLCLNSLLKYKCIGVNQHFYHDKTLKYSLFMENFWWATSDYIIKYTRVSNNKDILLNKNYIKYWIIGNLYKNDYRNILSLHNIDYDLDNIYQHNIQPNEYRLDVIKNLISNNLNKPFEKRRPIYGVYFICCLNNYFNIIKNQISKLIESGLYNETDKIFCFVCNQTIECLHLLKQYNKIEIIGTCENLYEKFAINNYKKYISGDYYLYYIHSKSITRKEQCYIDWTNLCNYITINKWRLSIELLKYYDTVGINLKNFPKRHYSGNFWWSKSEHLNKLIDINNDYLSPEMYILSYIKTNYISLYESNIIHVLKPYHQELYINKSDIELINNINIIPDYNIYDKKCINRCGKENLLYELPIL